MPLEIFKLLSGLYLAIKGADILVSSSVSLGRKFKISEFFIGLIIVGFGTSISELLVSIEAVLNNSADLSVGNIIGSNIANILLVISVVGFIKKITINNIALIDILFHFGIHLVFYLIFNFSKFDNEYGILFISLFLVYIYVSIKKSKVSKEIENENDADLFSVSTFKRPILFGIPILSTSIILTLFGVDLAVDSAVKISKNLNIPSSFIGLSLIAIGTSLPELVTSISAARRGKGAIIFGNIIGSNIYNLLFILGISSLFKFFNYDFFVLKFDVSVLLIVTCIFSFGLIKKSLLIKKHL